MTTYFYTPPSRVRGDRLSLPADESAHAVRVLRRRVGDEILVVDGEGGWYRVVLETADVREASGRVVERRQEVGEPAFHLTIGMALLKQEKRFEQFLEKATELGVSDVLPLLTERTEKGSIRPARVEHILQAAMKQCLRSRIVGTLAPMTLDAALGRAEGGPVFICHEAVAGEAPGIVEAIEAAGSPARLTVCVGPEGGFTEEEVAMAVAAGGRAVSLGSRRLRAETAAMAACAAVMIHYERLGRRAV